MKHSFLIPRVTLLLIYLMTYNLAISQENKSTNYSVLVSLFKEWRAFEKPSLRNGAPDYTVENF